MLCILSSFKANLYCFLETRTLYGVPMIYYPFCNTVGIGYVEEFPHALANDNQLEAASCFCLLEIISEVLLPNISEVNEVDEQSISASAR